MDDHISTKTALFTTALLLLIAPPTAGDGVDPAPSCDSLSDESLVTVPFSALPGDVEEQNPYTEYALGSDLYVHAGEDGPGGDHPVYQETNGFAGLQTEPGSCDSTGDGFANHRYTGDDRVPWFV